MGTTIAAGAQTSDEPKLEVKPSARILFDAAYVNPQHQEDKLNSGAGIPDMRVGVSFSYDPTNFVRGGYFIHQYGYQSCTSSSFKETMEEPQCNAVFNNDRMLGLMFEHTDDKVLATASFVVETDAMKATKKK